MKHLLNYGLVAILFFSYHSSHAQQVAKVKGKGDVSKVKGMNGNKSKQTKSGNGNISMQGAYAMYNQVVNDGTKDSVMGNEQLKIFTDRYMMYAHKNANDSTATYGVGTYKIQNGKVIEYVFYTSGDGARNDTFQLDINLANDGYTQIINFPAEQGRILKLTEDYKSVGKNITTPLDGAWKQTKSVYTMKDGKSIADNNRIQYKMYQSGYFMWANTVTDSATKKPVSFFGYGTFEMNSDKATEVNTNSSFVTDLVGRPITLNIEFTGKDAYQQTIIWPDGTKSIEYYERLK